MQDESVYLGLGSNVGNRIVHLRAGLAGLREHGLRLRAISSFYLTEPDLRSGSGEPVEVVGANHPWYINCVAAVDGAPAADQLVELCLAVEHDRGRSRRPTSEGCGPPEPRVLDVDVLMIGEHIIENSSICVPHPRMQNRRFVLAPLAEIAPQARHPVAGETIGDMLTALPERERVWLLAPPPGEAG